MHRTSRRPLLSAALVAVLAGCSDGLVTAPDASPLEAPSLSIVDGSASAPTYMIVGSSANGLPKGLEDAIAANGGELLTALPQIGVAVVRSSNEGFADAMAAFKGVQAVAPDLVATLDDPMTGDAIASHGSAPAPAAFFDALLWGVKAVGAPAAWAAGNQGQGVRVVVLDSGIDHDHPDLAPNINAALSASFQPCSPNGNCVGAFEDWRVRPGSFFNHGSHVAGIIGASGSLGIHGVAPEVELVAVKACTEFGTSCNGSAIVSGLVYAAEIDADLVNMSIGGLRFMSNDWVPYCKSLGYPANFCAKLVSQNAGGQAAYVHNTILVYKRAFQYAQQKGTTVIVAAGNDQMDLDHNGDIRHFAADFPQTIGVSALGPVGWCEDPSTSLDELAYYSNYGRSAVDVAAPGGNFFGFFLGQTQPCTVGGLTRPAYVFDGVFSTVSGGWNWAQGTSMAAPHATGVAALLIAANGGSMNPSQVERALKANALDLGQNGTDPIFGKGRVHAGY